MMLRSVLLCVAAACSVVRIACGETLVLCSGEEWCVAGERVRKTCESPAFAAALGNRFQLIPEEKAEGFVCETRRYPALFVFDEQRRPLARFENIPHDISAAALADLVRTAQRDAAEAIRLLESKEFGRGFEILRKLNPGLFARVGKKKEWTAVGFEDEFTAMCAADPDDREGYVTAFTAGDGYGRVSTASGLAGKPEGAAFVKSLRALTTAHATVEQLQSIDMAEFAYLRKDGQSQDRCKALLRKIVESDKTTLWAWAAHGYLKEMGEEVEMPNDPVSHVPGGKGIVDYRLVEPQCVLSGDGLVRLRGKGDGTDDEVRRAWAWQTIGREAFDKVVGEGGVEFARQFLTSREWLDGFLFSGPVSDPARAFSLLATIVRNDADGWFREPLGRTVATAIALNVHEKTTDERAVRLYLAYRHLAKVGRLHRFAYKQDVREWRFVIGKVPDAADILFVADFLNYPLAKYDGACWCVPYRGRNCFGESIHGKSYFRPWDGSDWPSLKVRQRVGAVCGGLSNFGATAANAHGIMAMTAGQPGHCAYVLRREDTKRWGIAYSISRYTGPHYLFYRAGFTELDALERAYANRESQIKADLLVARAKLAEADGADEKEIEMFYSDAARACRSHVGVWFAYADWLNRSNADEQRMRAFMRALARALPDGRQVVWNIENDCLRRLAERPDGKEKTAAALEELYPLLPQSTDEPIREECNWRKIMQVHGQLVGDELAGRLLAAALKANLGRGDYFAATLGWGSDALLTKANRGEEFAAALRSIASSAGGTGRIDLREAIRNASRSGSLDVFRALVDLNDRFNPPDRNVMGYPTEDFGGELLSAKGMLRTSSTAKWDKPEFYGRVIDATGFAGKNTQFFHTHTELSPWAAVELPGPADVKGVRLVNRFVRKDLAGRQVPFRVAVSENGEDWTDVASETECKDEYEIPVARASRVRFVKVYRPGEADKKDFFHFQKILVYGKKLY